MELKKKKLNELSAREHEYFRRKDKACDEYQQKKEMPKRENDATEAVLATVIGIFSAMLMFFFG